MRAKSAPSRSLVTHEKREAPTGRSGSLALLAAVACTVFGSRLTIVSAFGSPVPILDQWDAEGAALYSPYLNGTLTFANLFASHNGHRIVITRVIALGHLELAGEWNTRLEMVFSAVVLAAVITWLAALLLPLVAPHRRLLLASFIALEFAFPIDFENTLWGFQSQVYLSLLFGVAALVAFAAASAFSPRWFGGLAAGVLAYFAFATGVATLPAAAVLVGLQLATRARRRCGREIAGVVVIAIVAAALTLWGAGSTTPMSTPGTFVLGLGIFTALTIAGAIPIVLYCRHLLAQRPGVSDHVWVILGISGWVAIQLVLFAYGRGSAVAPRYLDVVLLVYPMAFVAVFALSDNARTTETGPRPRRGAMLWALAAVTFFAIAGGLSVLACSYWSRAADQEIADVRAYLVTGNVNQLQERGGPNHGVSLVHPYPARQAAVLGDPEVRAILPPELRPADADNAAVRNHLLLRGRASAATDFAVHWILAAGPVFLALGIGLFFAFAMARNRAAPGAAAQPERGIKLL